ncbi:MAG: UvrD-helicase domain-containing protein, partial [Selenomonadaceae bacterium]
MPWSKEQLRAITTYDKNLLVAAAAGSGKTAVLVERIIRRLLDQQCDIDEILVVTFTNAAAAEMRERVARAIQAALETNPGAQYLERQLVLMNAAAISTLHAFCQSIIRQNFHQLDIDPKFRLASEQEMELLRHDVLESLFAIKYDSAESEFLDFVDAYGSERSDEALYEIVLKLYQYACSQPFSENWLASL